MTSGIRSVALLANLQAGHGRARRAAAEAEAAFRERGVEVRTLTPTCATASREMTAQVVAAGADRADAVVVVGGDGMVHMALQSLVGTEVPLGVIPAGTGNDQARFYGWPRDSVADAVEVVLAGRTRRIDVGEAVTADGRRTCFGSVLAAGFDSLVSDRVNRMTWPHGRARYNLAILAEFVNLRPLPMTVRLADGTAIDDELMLVAVGNTSSYGGGMRICPGADASDGLFDVTVSRAMPRHTALGQVPRIYRGTHVDRPEVTTYRTSEITIEAPGLNAYADGELLGPLPVTARIVPAALSVLTPGADDDLGES